MDISLDIRRQLYEAVCNDDSKTIRKIAETLPFALDGGWSGGTGPSYLHLAARKGQLEVCKTLVELGTDINIADPCGNGVPLDEAATGGHLATVQWLLDHGARVDGLPTSVCTPLMAAAIEGHLEIVRLLLDAGAEINREHLRLPQTALDFAEVYRVKQSGQDAVAELLRERGGIRPYYAAPHDWNGVPGQFYIEHIERAIGAFVNPIPLAESDLSKGNKVTIRRIRIPTKWDYQLLFTIGVANTGRELAICLPSAWPLNNATLKDHRYAWPVSLLFKLSTEMVNGLSLSHGDVLDRSHPALEGSELPDSIYQWIVVLGQSLETERGDDERIPQTLFLVPILSKKRIPSGPEALAKADKLRMAKWKALALPLDA